MGKPLRLRAGQALLPCRLPCLAAGRRVLHPHRHHFHHSLLLNECEQGMGQRLTHLAAVKSAHSGQDFNVRRCKHPYDVGGESDVTVIDFNTTPQGTRVKITDT